MTDDQVAILVRTIVASTMIICAFFGVVFHALTKVIDELHGLHVRDDIAKKLKTIRRMKAELETSSTEGDFHA